jgi:DNA polymerase-3 subunit epsilon
MREIVLDTETTGLSYINGDRLIEIGCVEIIDKKITGNIYHTYINPETEVSEEATSISGLTYEFLKKFKIFKDIYHEFLDFISDDRLVIHNAQFDIGFLNHELKLVNEEPILSERVIDTLAMAKEKYPGSPATLDALCRRFSIDSTTRAKHGALVDAKLLVAVYLYMSVELLQKDIFGIGQNMEEALEIQDTTAIRKIKKRTFRLNEFEAIAHEKLLKKIKNPIWEKIKESANLVDL